MFSGATIAFLILFRAEVDNYVHSSDMGMVLSYFGYNLLESGQIARLIDLDNTLTYDLQCDFNLTSNIQSLTQYKDYLVKYSKQNTYFFDHYTESSIPAVNSNGSITNTNIINLSLMYLNYLTKDSLQNLTFNNTELRFLYQNSFGYSYNTISSENYINFYEYNGNLYLIYYSLSILLLFFIFALYYITFLNRFHKVIKKSSEPIYFIEKLKILGIYKGISKRLREVHSCVLNRYKNIKERKKVVYSFYLGYVYVLIVLGFVIGLVGYYGLGVYNDFGLVRDALDNLPKIYLVETENILKNWEYSMEISVKSPLSTIYVPDYYQEFNHTIENLLENHKKIMSLFENLNRIDGSLLINATDSSYPELAKGLMPGISEYTFLNKIISLSRPDLTSIQHSFNLSKTLSKYILTLVSSTKATLNTKVNQIFQTCMIITVTLSACTILAILFLVFYINRLELQIKYSFEFVENFKLLEEK